MFLALQGALAGRYSLERELGRGGMGIVYLAHEVRLDRPVALKLLPTEMATQPALRERFLREARTAARLSHPNIVPIHAVDEVDDFVFFAMAYVEGQTLGERIRERGPVPAREAARILREVAWALAYAHGQGVVHRDVKPDNILIEAGTGRALVTDFGIAHVSATQNLTGSGEVMGTAEFMSPEQAAGDPVDERSDLYSLGVVGHYMLSGRLPFEGDTVAATLAKQITQAAPALSSVSPEVPGDLAKAMERCLSKDPDKRYGDGGALAAALGRAVEVRRELPDPIRSFMERNEKSSSALVTTALGAALLVLLSIRNSGFGDLVAAIFMATVALVLAATPPLLLLHAARRLLRSGYGYDDLIRELRADLELRRGELAAQHGPKTWVDRWARKLTYAGSALFLGWVGLIPLLPERVVQLLLFAPVLPASLGLIGAGFVGGLRHKLRTALPREGWFKFWKGRVGRWLFKVAGVERAKLESGPTPYRPTELAIGMAADRLYDELPKDVRAAFPELPDVVRSLERDAERMRARVEELNELMTQVEDGGASAAARTAAAPGVAGERDALANELQEARDAAEERLSEVVAALEAVRLGLLRMHAGAGSVEGMTADLGAAKGLSEEIGYLLEGKQAVAELLGLVESKRLGDTPIPTPA